MFYGVKKIRKSQNITDLFKKIFYCFLHTLSTLTSLLTQWYTDIYNFKFTKFQTYTNTSVQSLFDDTGNIP